MSDHAGGAEAPDIRWAIDNVRGWREELASVLDDAEAWRTPEAARRRVLDELDALAAGMEALDRSGSEPDRSAATEMFRRTLTEKLLLRDRTSPLYDALGLGPGLALHVRDRMAHALATFGEAGGGRERVRLWTGSFLEASAARVQDLLPRVRRLIQEAPLLGDREREELDGRAGGIEAAVREESVRAIVTAEPKLAGLLSDLDNLARPASVKRLAEMEEEYKPAEARWHQAEEEAWRYSESTLFGGRGLGTVALAWFTVAFLALLVKEQVARLMLAGVAIVGAAAWLFIWYKYVKAGTRYREAADEAKRLLKPLRELRIAYQTYSAQVADLKSRLRDGGA